MIIKVAGRLRHIEQVFDDITIGWTCSSNGRNKKYVQHFAVVDYTASKLSNCNTKNEIVKKLSLCLTNSALRHEGLDTKTD
jgi:hypothetical protein